MDEISLIDVMPNQLEIKGHEQTHRIYFHDFCPISGNPAEGSFVEITYKPEKFFLEVYSLYDFIFSFQYGGKYKGNFVRDMEQLIQVIHNECTIALGVQVTTKAYLLLDKGEMRVTLN